MAIFPANRPELVQALIEKLSDDVDPDKPIIVEAQREDKGKRTPQRFDRLLEVLISLSEQILRRLARLWS